MKLKEKQCSNYHSKTNQSIYNGIQLYQWQNNFHQDSGQLLNLSVTHATMDDEEVIDEFYGHYK